VSDFLIFQITKHYRRRFLSNATVISESKKLFDGRRKSSKKSKKVIEEIKETAETINTTEEGVTTVSDNRISFVQQDGIINEAMRV
jgi:hypothetical protein